MMGRSYPIKRGGRVKGFRSRGSHPKASESRRVVRVDRLSDSVASFASAKGWLVTEPTHTRPTSGFEVRKPSLTAVFIAVILGPAARHGDDAAQLARPAGEHAREPGAAAARVTMDALG